jgi:prevent-host-death family protein
MEISIRELRAHLSKYLKLVGKGEQIVVTHRRNPIARLSGITPQEKSALGRLLAGGLITWNGRKPAGGRLMPEIKGKTLAERVLEDRR